MTAYDTTSIRNTSPSPSHTHNIFGIHLCAFIYAIDISFHGLSPFNNFGYTIYINNSHNINSYNLHLVQKCCGERSRGKKPERTKWQQSKSDEWEWGKEREREWNRSESNDDAAAATVVAVVASRKGIKTKIKCKMDPCICFLQIFSASTLKCVALSLSLFHFI